MAGQTETWTLLFTDLAASPTLCSRLGGNWFDAFRRRHDDLMRSRVVGHRDEVVMKLLGDDVMAAFGGAVEAVDAVVEIQQRLEPWQQTDSDAGVTGVGVGLSIGRAQRNRRDLNGVVVDAARLCAATPPGRIVCDEPGRHVSEGRAGDGSPPGRRSSWKAYHPSTRASCNGSAAV